MNNFACVVRPADSNKAKPRAFPVCVLVLAVVLSHATPSLAGDPPPTKTNGPETKMTEGSAEHSANPPSIQHPTSTNWSAIAGVLGVVLGAAVQEFLKRRKLDEAAQTTRKVEAEKQKAIAGQTTAETEKQKIVDGINKPVQVPPGQRRNSIMLLGLGGTGKTTLIRKMLLNDNANPEERTESYEIYQGANTATKLGANQTPNNDQTTYYFYISDYMGQNIGTLVRSFIEQQFKLYSPMAYGHITSLILMVDLVPPPKQKSDHPPTQRDGPDTTRVNHHLTEWNDLALDAVFGLVTDTLRFVCLFINKVDLMNNVSEENKKKYIDCFEPLRERLQNRCPNIKVATILGSVEHGTGMNRLRSELVKNSV